MWTPEKFPQQKYHNFKEKIAPIQTGPSDQNAYKEILEPLIEIIMRRLSNQNLLCQDSNPIEAGNRFLFKKNDVNFLQDSYSESIVGNRLKKRNFKSNLQQQLNNSIHKGNKISKINSVIPHQDVNNSNPQINVGNNVAHQSPNAGLFTQNI